MPRNNKKGVKGAVPLTAVQKEVYFSMKEGSLASVTSIRRHTDISRMGIIRALDVLVVLGFLKETKVGNMRIVWKEGTKSLSNP